MALAECFQADLTSNRGRRSSPWVRTWAISQHPRLFPARPLPHPACFMICLRLPRPSPTWLLCTLAPAENKLSKVPSYEFCLKSCVCVASSEATPLPYRIWYTRAHMRFPTSATAFLRCRDTLAEQQIGHGCKNEAADDPPESEELPTSHHQLQPLSTCRICMLAPEASLPHPQGIAMRQCPRRARSALGPYTNSPTRPPWPYAHVVKSSRICYPQHTGRAFALEDIGFVTHSRIGLCLTFD